MNTYGVPIRPGQIWGDAQDMRELTIKKVDNRYAYCLDNNGRSTRILKRRMKPSLKGYYLKNESPARYVDVASETGDCKCGKNHKDAHHLSDGCRRCRNGVCAEFRPEVIYHVWTGDELSPAHCPCENFRWATREPGELYYCKHLRQVLFGKKGDE